MQVNGRPGLRQGGRSAPSRPAAQNTPPPPAPPAHRISQHSVLSPGRLAPCLAAWDTVLLRLSGSGAARCSGLPIHPGLRAPWLGIPTLSAPDAGPLALHLSGPERISKRRLFCIWSPEALLGSAGGTSLGAGPGAHVLSALCAPLQSSDQSPISERFRASPRSAERFLRSVLGRGTQRLVFLSLSFFFILTSLAWLCVLERNSAFLSLLHQRPKPLFSITVFNYSPAVA